MRTAFFIARRLRYAGAQSFSARIIQIATATIGLGLAVMIVAVCVLEGFRQNIEQTLFRFSAHLRIQGYNADGSAADVPFTLNSAVYKEVTALPQVSHVQPSAFKPALLRAGRQVQGVVMKGLHPAQLKTPYAPQLLRGKLPDLQADSIPDQIIISAKQARLLELDTGQSVVLFFMQDPPRARRVAITGIYESGLEEFDDNLILGDLRMIQQLNGWGRDTSSFYEVYLHQFNDLGPAHAALQRTLPMELTSVPITETHLATFEWLGMIARNVQILVGLITLVACFNMVTTVLIMILERTHMVGLLKALGGSNRFLRQIFVLNGVRFIVRGMLWGNAVGLALCALQYYFRLIPLDVENYYISYVPIAWAWPGILLVNALVLVLTSASLLLPSMITARLKPTAAIRFD